MRRHWKVVTVTAVMLMVMTAGFAAFRYEVRKEACVHFETVLARDGRGRAVVDTYEACTVLGTFADESIDLVLPGGRRKRIFEFEPSGGAFCRNTRGPLEPAAQWTDHGVLRISIGTVGSISEQQAQVDDIPVIYDIGEDLSHCRRPSTNGSAGEESST